MTGQSIEPGTGLLALAAGLGGAAGAATVHVLGLEAPGAALVAGIGAGIGPIMVFTSLWLKQQKKQ